MATLETLEARIVSLEKAVSAIKTNQDRIVKDLANKATTADILREDTSLRELIIADANLIRDLQERLSKIILPEETRYYLEDSEVEAFQSNFNKLRAMMIQVDKLYKNLVAYESNRTN